MAQADPQNILVIHFGQLGDVVLGLSALQAVRRRFSASRITLLVGMSAAEIAKLAKVADDFMIVDRVKLRDGNKFRSIGQILRLTREVRGRKFDLVVDLHSLSETNLLGFLAGIPSRLYGNRESRSLDKLSNFRPRPQPEDKTKHLTDRYFDVIMPLGISRPTRTVHFDLPIESRDVVFRRFPALFDDSKTRVGLFPGAGHPSRRWPLEKFGDLTNRLADRGYVPVVFLGPEEAELRDEIVEKFPSRTHVIDGLTIAEFIAAIATLSALVSNDTGPAHLAGCAGVPLVLLLDERAPTTYLPLGERIRVVREGTIDAIGVADVMATALDLLENDKLAGEC